MLQASSRHTRQRHALAAWASRSLLLACWPVSLTATGLEGMSQRQGRTMGVATRIMGLAARSLPQDFASLSLRCDSQKCEWTCYALTCNNKNSQLLNGLTTKRWLCDSAMQQNMSTSQFGGWCKKTRFSFDGNCILPRNSCCTS